MNKEKIENKEAGEEEIIGLEERKQYLKMKKALADVMEKYGDADTLEGMSDYLHTAGFIDENEEAEEDMICDECYQKKCKAHYKKYSATRDAIFDVMEKYGYDDMSPYMSGIIDTLTLWMEEEDIAELINESIETNKEIEAEEKAEEG